MVLFFYCLDLLFGYLDLVRRNAHITKNHVRMPVIWEMSTLVAVYVECLAHGNSSLFVDKVTKSSCHNTI